MPISNQQHQLQQQRLKSNILDLNHKNVSKLYDLCIKSLIKNNLYLIINNDNKYEQLKLKYKLPATICDSIIADYSIYYENKIRILERNQYFMLNQLLRQHKRKQQQKLVTTNVDEELQQYIENFINDNKENLNLISSYELLKCFAKELCVSTAIYKHCMRTQTPLNECLRKILKTTKANVLTAEIIEHVHKILNLRIINNPKHLNDADLELLSKNKIEYLDICPCVLTNRAICLINSNLKCLKYLKLQNYCDWNSNECEFGRIFQRSYENFDNSDDNMDALMLEDCEDDDNDDDDDDEDDDYDDEHGFARNNNNNAENNNDNIEYIDEFEEEEDEEQGEEKTRKLERTSSTSSDSTSSSDKEELCYMRLLRQYHFLNNTNISNKKNKDKNGGAKTSSSDNGITANLHELIKSLLSRKIFRTNNNETVKKKRKYKKQSTSSVTNLSSTLTTTTSNLLSLLPLWMSKHIDLINKSNNETSASTSAAAAAATASADDINTSELYNNLNDFFLNEQNSTYMNEEEVAKYLLNLELLAKEQHNDDTEDDDDYYSDSERPLDKHLKYLNDEDDNVYMNAQHNKLNIDQFSVLNLENLQYLSLKSLDNCLKVNILNDVLVNFKQLKYLDLTSCFKSTVDECLTPKPNLENSLKHLIFSNFNPDELVLNSKFILSLRKLNYLDISNYREKPLLNVYKNPSCLLAKLVLYLKNLHSLDISGTNLGGADLFKIEDEIEYIKGKLLAELQNEINDEFKTERIQFLNSLTPSNCNQSKISGLLFLNSKLNFLGCLNCDQNVSAREQIPAIHIAGEAKEQYLFTCLEVYLDKPLFILDSLNHLFELYRDDMITDKSQGGYLIMNCMQKYLNNSRIQISGSASLFYVLKYSKDENKQLPQLYIKQLVETIMNGMEEHMDANAVRTY